MGDDEQHRVSAAQEQQFASLLLQRATGHAAIFMDCEGIISGWSQGATRITGFLPAEMIGQPLSALFTFEDRELGLPAQELKVASIVGFAQDERWQLRRDASRFWASGLTYSQRDAEGIVTGYVKLFRDATHLRTRMKYLENVIADLSRRQLERDTFIGTIAGGLRNPLQPIKAGLELLKASPDPGSGHEESLNLINRQLGLLERLVEDLVDLTRTNVGKLRVDLKPIVIQELIHSAISDCETKATAANVRLHMVLPDQPLRADVDEGRLEQVVVTLVLNSIKFTPPGGSVWITCTTDQSHLLIAVKDDGHGISPDVLPTIFDAFTQAGDVPAGRGMGLGTGLSVVKEIVTRHGGSVDVRSEGPGKGAEFTVRLPLHAQTGESQPTVDSPARQSKDGLP